jgi:hypothetical protein
MRDFLAEEHDNFDESLLIDMLRDLFYFPPNPDQITFPLPVGQDADISKL